MDDSPLVHYLKYELTTTREDLQNTIENMESANENFKSQMKKSCR